MMMLLIAIRTIVLKYFWEMLIEMLHRAEAYHSHRNKYEKTCFTIAINIQGRK